MRLGVVIAQGLPNINIFYHSHSRINTPFVPEQSRCLLVYQHQWLATKLSQALCHQIDNIIEHISVSFKLAQTQT